MITKETLDKIRKTILDFGDGLCEFETRDIEGLLRSYEELQKAFKEVKKTLDSYQVAEMNRVYGSNNIEMSKIG